ncbi:hypothetical protein ACFL1H_07800, partial [Nanoarchaeota archaeon]
TLTGLHLGYCLLNTGVQTDLPYTNATISGTIFGLEVGRAAYMGIRDCMINIDEFGDLPCGSVFGTILTLPVSLYYKIKNDNKEIKRNTYCKFIFRFDKLADKIQQNEVHLNHYGLLEHLAKIEIEDEENLIWDRDNHHSQTKTFSKRFYQEIISESTPFETLKFTTGEHIEKELNSYTIYDHIQSDDYHKYSALVCFKDKRYPIVCITKNKWDLDNITKIMSKQNSFEDKFSEIKNQSEYLHMSYFENNNKINEIARLEK